jgi:hypothetical protein
MQAIQTQYAGCKFRSRVEARWAVLMDSLGVSWEYEKEGFNLGVDGLYLPDFWIPAQECWLEIKGAQPTSPEMAKATALAEQSRQSVHMFWGKVAPDPFWSVPLWGHEGEWGGLTIHPSCRCGQLKVGVHAKWTSWQICHACDVPHISNTASPCECHPDWHHCAESKRRSSIYPQCYLDETGRRRRCHHDDTMQRAYAGATSARFEHGESGVPKRGIGGIPRLWPPAIPWSPDADPGF